MLNFNKNACLELKTINDFLRYAYSYAIKANLFYGHGTDNAWDDVRQLILDSLSLPHDVDLALLSTNLTNQEKTFLSEQLDKRINQRIPVVYLTKKAYFCHLDFYVDERVIIPRSPIAELIENQFSPWIDPQNITSILDMCTGSGCIAIACCYAFPDAEVDAVDLSKDALEIAQINLNKHNLNDQLRLYQSNCFQNLKNKKYDIIISNPPYVAHDEVISLPREYQYEPNMALEADNEGLAIVEEIIHKAPDYLNPNGILIIEVGNNADLLEQTYPDLPFTWLEFENGGQGVFLLYAEELNNYFKSR